MPTRRTILHASALPLIAASVAAEGPPLALIADYAACSERTAVVYARRDEAERAMWKRGDEHCALLEACDQDLMPFWDDMNAITRRSVTEPARDLLGVVDKMLVWRAEAALFGARLEKARDMEAFGAYQDLLRLAGKTHLAHPLDAKRSPRSGTASERARQSRRHTPSMRPMGVGPQ